MNDPLIIEPPPGEQYEYEEAYSLLIDELRNRAMDFICVYENGGLKHIWLEFVYSARYLMNAFEILERQGFPSSGLYFYIRDEPELKTPFDDYISNNGPARLFLRPNTWKDAKRLLLEISYDRELYDKIKQMPDEQLKNLFEYL